MDAELGTSLLLAAGAGVLSLLARRRRGAAAQRIASSDRLRLVLRGTVIHSRSRTVESMRRKAEYSVTGVTLNSRGTRPALLRILSSSFWSKNCCGKRFVPDVNIFLPNCAIRAFRFP